LATLWAIFSQTHLVTLIESEYGIINLYYMYCIVRTVVCCHLHVGGLRHDRFQPGGLHVRQLGFPRGIQELYDLREEGQTMKAQLQTYDH
jgi:hypothetical protein